MKGLQPFCLAECSVFGENINQHLSLILQYSSGVNILDILKSVLTNSCKDVTRLFRIQSSFCMQSIATLCLAASKQGDGKRKRCGLSLLGKQFAYYYVTLVPRSNRQHNLGYCVHQTLCITLKASTFFTNPIKFSADSTHRPRRTLLLLSLF